jgi:hypothetical protein
LMPSMDIGLGAMVDRQAVVGILYLLSGLA